jgi:hypothetical protein
VQQRLFLGVDLGVSSKIIALHQENLISCEKLIAAYGSAIGKPDESSRE